MYSNKHDLVIFFFSAQENNLALSCLCILPLSFSRSGLHELSLVSCILSLYVIPRVFFWALQIF